MRESGMYDDDGLDDDDDGGAAEVVHTRHDLVGAIFAASPRSKVKAGEAGCLAPSLTAQSHPFLPSSWQHTRAHTTCSPWPPPLF
jgi:hypothetical protein